MKTPMKALLIAASVATAHVAVANTLTVPGTADPLLAGFGARQDTCLRACLDEHAGNMILQQHRDVNIVLVLAPCNTVICCLETLTGIDNLRLDGKVFRHGEL